ncbi:MAG: hypothetical protein ACOX6V_03265 [Patescibacteria group bacterium]|jgi:hypothetical protein
MTDRTAETLYLLVERISKVIPASPHTIFIAIYLILGILGLGIMFYKAVKGFKENHITAHGRVFTGREATRISFYYLSMVVIAIITLIYLLIWEPFLN